MRPSCAPAPADDSLSRGGKGKGLRLARNLGLMGQDIDRRVTSVSALEVG